MPGGLCLGILAWVLIQAVNENPRMSSVGGWYPQLEPDQGANFHRGQGRAGVRKISNAGAEAGVETFYKPGLEPEPR